MATYTVSIYDYDPYGQISSTINGFTTYSGPATADGTAVITDNAAGTAGQVLEDTALETATADVTIGGNTSTGSAVFASEVWTLRDTVTGQQFEITAMRVSSGAASGYYTLSEVPLIAGRSYETLAYDEVPDSGAGDPVITYAQIVCFTRGAPILTPAGYVAIEKIRVGDLVTTLDQGPQPVRWISNRRLDARQLARHPEIRPIRIARDVLGNIAPVILSPQHGMLVPGTRRDVFRHGDTALVRAKHLAMLMPGKVRVLNRLRRVAYYHLLFDRHQIITVAGALSESFYPGNEALKGLTDAAAAELRRISPGVADFIRARDVPNSSGPNSNAPNSNAPNPYGPPARPYARARDLCLPRNPALRQRLYLPEPAAPQASGRRLRLIPA